MNPFPRSAGKFTSRLIISAGILLGAVTASCAPTQAAQILSTTFWGGSGGLGSVDQYTFPGGAFQNSLIPNYPLTPGGSFGPSGLAVASNGSFYVGLEQPFATSADSNIQHYNANGTTATMQLAISNSNVNGGAGIYSVGGVRIGPDGNVYVSDIGAGEVFEFNGATGAYIATPISGLTGPSQFSLLASGITFDSHGNLYVGLYGVPGSQFSAGFGGAVYEATYNSGTYTQVGTPFIGVGAGPSGNALANADGLLFLPNGNLLVADQGSAGANILEFPSTGAAASSVTGSVFASLSDVFAYSPGNMVFTPNGQDILITALGYDDPSTTGEILEYDLSGNYVATLATGLAGPTDLAVVPEPSSWVLSAIGSVGLLLFAVKRRRNPKLARVRVGPTGR